MASNQVVEAPVFYPTIQEWNEGHPLSYLELVVRPIAESTGICKIVPPENWKPPFSIENATFKFATRVQHLNLLEGSFRIRDSFEKRLRKFHFVQGRPMLRPREGNSANWCVLFREVTQRGGFLETSKKNVWDDVYEAIIQSKDEVFSKLSLQQLIEVYETYLLDFEDNVLKGLTSESKKNKRARRSNLSFRSSLDAKRLAMDGLLMGARGKQAGELGAKIGEEAAVSATMLVSSITASRKTRSTTKKNLGELKAQKSTVKFPDVGKPAPVEDVIEIFSCQPEKPKSGDCLWKWFEDEKNCFHGKIKTSFKSDQKQVFWRVHYQSGDKSFIREEEEGDLALALACGETPEEAIEAFRNGVCQRCNRANDVASIVSCDGCELRFHEDCLLDHDRPSKTRDLDWFCPICIDSFQKELEGQQDIDEEDQEDLEALRKNIELSAVTKAIGVHSLAEFGFPDGDKYSLEEYVSHDQYFRKRYEEKLGKPIFVSEQEVEDEFWRLAQGKRPLPTYVNYGNDLDTSALGSGFPTKEKLLRAQKKIDRLPEQERLDLERYAISEWNLNNLPTSPGSLLQHVEANISGVIVPWLYMGMTFSAFCFHVEDHNFASINYHHLGAAKSWWGVPAIGADQFEKVAQEMCPELFEARPDLLQGIVTQFNPQEMASRGVPMYHLIQRPGDFVVTFPRAYHGGFNHGFNSAEAVNFAGKHWLSFGLQAVHRYSFLRKTPVIAHEALLLTISAWCLKNHDSNESFRIGIKLIAPFQEILFEEKKRRAEIMAMCQKKSGVFKSSKQLASILPKQRKQTSKKNSRSKKAKVPSPPQKKERNVYIMGRIQTLASVFDGVPRCTLCKRYCPFSHGLSPAPSLQVYCLEHSHPDYIFVESYDLETLDEFLKKLSEKCMDVEHWIERANRLCLGIRQPDSLLGTELAGGPPFAFQLTRVLSTPFRLELSFPRLSEWKVKPSMEAVQKLLEMKSAVLVEESFTYFNAFNICQNFCSQVLTELTSYARVIISADIEARLTAVKTLPLEIPKEIVKTLVEIHEGIVFWRSRARAVLDAPEQSPEQLHRILTELRNARVDISEIEEVNFRLFEFEWFMRVSHIKAEKPPPASEFHALLFHPLALASSKIQNSPEKRQLDQLFSVTFEFEKQIKHFLENPVNPEVLPNSVEEIRSKCAIIPINFQAFVEKKQKVQKWYEQSLKLNSLKGNEVLQLEKEGEKLNIQKSFLKPIQEINHRLAEFKNNLDMHFYHFELSGERPNKRKKIPFSFLRFLQKKRICLCNQESSGDTVACPDCQRSFHAACFDLKEAKQVDIFLCGDCFSKRSRICYCRDPVSSVVPDNTNLLTCTGCDEKFHRSCAQISDAQPLIPFYCLNCSNSGISLCGKCNVACKADSGLVFTCRNCEKDFHGVCAKSYFIKSTVPSSQDSYVCETCCASLDIPYLVDGSNGFEKKAAEIQNRVKQLRRPSMTELDGILRPVKDYSGSLSNELFELKKILQPVYEWLAQVELLKKRCGNDSHHFCTASDIDLWKLLDDSFGFLVFPSDQVFYEICGELLRRHRRNYPDSRSSFARLPQVEVIFNKLIGSSSEYCSQI